MSTHLVGNLLLDDQLVLRIDCDLGVVADGNPRVRRHRPTVGIGQRDLVLAGPLQLFQHDLAPRAPLADRGDLLSQVLDPRASRLGLGGVALVEPLQIVVELGVGQFDELRQRRAGEVAVLVVDRLDPGAVDREQFPAEQVQLAAEQHELAEDRAEGVDG